MAGGSSINGNNNAVGNGKAPIRDGRPQEIDEDLHSRQLAVYGRETMRRLFASNILISGMQGLGAEIVPEWVKSPDKLANVVDQVIVPDFLPRKDAKIVTDEKATSLSTASVDDAVVIDELVMKLERCRKKFPAGYKMNPTQFEKDDDTNFHMDMIAGLANMRARNHSIPEVDKLKAKFIAGRIIPAIATLTAMATGLVCLELYKVLDGHHKVEDYRNTFANLALPFFSMAEPVPLKLVKLQDLSWTIWDRWMLKGNPTLGDLLQWLKNKGLHAYSISFGSCFLYNSMF